MIVADQKPFEQVKGFIETFEKVLVVGCGTCVTVCLSGGAAETQLLASGLRIAFGREDKQKVILEDTVQRQCDEEFVLPVLDRVKTEKIDAVITLACGVGVNFLADRLGDVPVFPGVDTTFYGAAVEPGLWAEMCAGCGNCITHMTGGICPIARCSKHLFNGPCGGSEKGKCEVNPKTTDCVWQLIYDRMKRLGRLDELTNILPVKDWRPASDGGVRRTVREHLYRLDYKQAQ
ncbi:MAG: methylenetetrahydrofolate reductase C-terminal domain-containing protein [Syntrophobacteraceae bacterium]